MTSGESHILVCNKNIRLEQPHSPIASAATGAALVLGLWWKLWWVVGTRCMVLDAW